MTSEVPCLLVTFGGETQGGVFLPRLLQLTLTPRNDPGSRGPSIELAGLGLDAGLEV